MRDLARGSYSAAQVLNQLLAPDGVTNQRFDLVDRQYRVIDRLDVTAATVDWDGSRVIPRSLTMSMLPRTDLLDVPFRLLVKPYWMLKMLAVDGGWAEFPMGAYVFTIPGRAVQENAAAASGASDLAGDGISPENPELWTMTLGDQMHYFAAGGVGQQGFVVPLGSLLTDAMLAALTRLNFVDTSGVARSEATAATQLSFTLAQGAQEMHYELTYVPGKLAYGAGGSYQWQQKVSRLQSAATNWSDVMTQLHSSLGYQPPGFDLDSDRYIAKPAIDASQLTGAPVISYEPGDSALLLPGVQVSPNLSGIKNRAIAVQANPSGYNDTAIVDLNDLIPGHPLSQGVCGFYMDLPLTSPGGSSYPQLQAQARAALLAAIQGYETVTFSSLCFPAHDQFEILSLRIPNDAIYGTPQLCSESSWNLDLFTSRMNHVARRLGLNATTQ